MQKTDIDLAEVAAKQKIEVEFWRNDPLESPESNDVWNIINKASGAAIFLDCLEKIKHEIVAPNQILELGAGQGWASCLMKRLYPQARVTATDISEYAIQSIHKWENVWQSKIDNAYPCKSYETREGDSTVDMVFCFAAAHHFLLHAETLRELHRILKPGGKAFYFYEPTATRLLYRLAYLRVNRKRPHVPEDVLIISSIRELAHANNLKFRVYLYPSAHRRAPFETIYYSILSRIPILAKLLPCTATFVFEK